LLYNLNVKNASITTIHTKIIIYIRLESSGRLDGDVSEDILFKCKCFK